MEPEQVPSRPAILLPRYLRLDRGAVVLGPPRLGYHALAPHTLVDTPHTVEIFHIR